MTNSFIEAFNSVFSHSRNNNLQISHIIGYYKIIKFLEHYSAIIVRPIDAGIGFTLPPEANCACNTSPVSYIDDSVFPKIILRREHLFQNNALPKRSRFECRRVARQRRCYDTKLVNSLQLGPCWTAQHASYC